MNDLDQQTDLGKLVYYESHGLPQAVADRYYRLLGPSGRILDLGCGAGEFGRFAATGVEVHGVDHDPGAVVAAARHEIVAHVDLEAGRLPYEDNYFDAILARDVFEHLRAAQDLAAEMRRVLRPAGRVVISVVNSQPRRLWADYTHVRGYTRASLRGFLEDSGFEVHGVWPMGGVPLTSRLRLIGLLPYLLRVPGLHQVFASSWEGVASKPK